MLDQRPAKNNICSTNSLIIVGGFVVNNHDYGLAEQLAAYLGLVPAERQSGSSALRRARISKVGSARIRAVLYMAAVVGAYTNPHFKAVYEQLLARGKSKMSPFCAALRKLVHLCFGVLKTNNRINTII